MSTTDSIIPIPEAVFMDPKFIALKPGDRSFLLHLYRLFSDCDTFSIDATRPAAYGEASKFTVLARVTILLKSGLIVRKGQGGWERSGPRPRVFTFKHSAVRFYERDAA